MRYSILDVCKASFLIVGVWVMSFSSVFASSIPHIHTWKTSAGTPVYFVQRTQQPMVDINVVIDAGSARDGESWGLSMLTGLTLDQGTQKLSADQVATQFAEIGSQYEAESSLDMVNIGLRSLTRHDTLQSSLQLFHAILTQPAFPEPAIKREKNQMITALQYEDQDPAAVAQKVFFQSLYHKGPYAHNVLGTKDSVKGLTAEQVQQFYHTYYVAQNAKIIMVGDLTVERAKKVSEQLLAGMPSGVAAKPLPELVSQTKGQITNVDFQSSQSTIFLGQLGITRENPDYYAIIVGNHILGGMPLSSVLFETVRNKNGLAYSVQSYFLPLQRKGPFIIALQTKANSTSKATAMTEKVLNDFVQNGVTKQQLKAAKANLMGSFPIAISSNADLIDVVTRIAFYNRPRDYLAMYRKHINAVTATDIKKAFDRLVSMNHLVVVTVGPDQNHA